MQVNQVSKSKKRSYREAFLPDELASRFKSKYDLRQYMSEHCKYFWFYITSLLQCNCFCLQTPRWIAISSSKCSKEKNSSFQSRRPSISTYPSTTSSLSRSFIRDSKMIPRSISFFRMNIRRTGSLIASIFSQSSTLCIPTMSAKWLSMQTASGSQRRGKQMRTKSWRSAGNGGTISISSPTSLVSIFFELTLSGCKGRTIHLLKESSKPVPKQKKRRKIEVLPMESSNNGISLMPSA